MDFENTTFTTSSEHRFDNDDVEVKKQALSVYLAEELFQLRGQEMALVCTNKEYPKLKGKSTSSKPLQYRVK